MDYIIPPEYVVLRDVQDKAKALWGVDAGSRLKYLVAQGKLDVWLARRDGDPKLTKVKFWGTTAGDRVFREDEFRDRGNDPRQRGFGRPVFLRDDVERVLMVKPLTASSPSELPVAPETQEPSRLAEKGGDRTRGSPERDAARYALMQLFPDGIPPGAFSYGKVRHQLAKAGTSVTESTLKRAVADLRSK